MAKTVKNKNQSEPKILENSTDVLEIDAEEVFPDEKIEEQISQELVKANVTDSVIAQLKEKYSHLTINGQDDKEGYLAVKEGRMDFKKLRVLVVKTCKKGREWAILEQKKWKSKEDELCAIIEIEENKLEVQEKAYEAERDRIKAELKAAQDKAFAVRSAELNSFGAVFNGTDYVLEDVAYEFSAIREADQEIYATIIKPKYEAVFNSKEAARIAAEKEKSEAAAALLLQQQEMARKEKEIRDRELAIQKQTDDLKAAEAARLETERLALENHQKQLLKARVSQLNALGMTYDYNAETYSIFGVGVSLADIKSNPDEKWDEQVKFFTSTVAAAKEQAAIVAENERIALEEKNRKDAEERSRMAAEKAIADERARVRAQDEANKEAARQAQIKAQQELEMASDKVKYNALLEQLAAIKFPECKSASYRNKVGLIRDFLDGVKNN